MTQRGILFHSGFLAERLGPLGMDCRTFMPKDIAGGVPREIAESVEVLVSAGGDLPNTLVDALPRLKLVACFSTGYAGIDLRHLQLRGIQLTTAAGVNAHDVADHAVGLMLALWHNIPAADRAVRTGAWRDDLMPRHSLRGRTAGVVGLGRIGEAIAHRLAAHEMQVRWWGPREKPGAAFERASSLVALAAESDVLVIASRATPENTGQIDAQVLQALGSTGMLINVSRGFLVDEDALLAALRSGVIGGAALDVFVDEPTDPARWRDLANVVLTPHLAGYTVEAGADMTNQLRENILRYFRGDPLLSPVSAEVAVS